MLYVELVHCCYTELLREKTNLADRDLLVFGSFSLEKVEKGASSAIGIACSLAFLEAKHLQGDAVELRLGTSWVVPDVLCDP